MHRTILTLALFAFISSLTASAQSVFVKIGGGFASQYDAAGHIGTSKIAIGYEHELSQRFAFAPSIGFSGRGWKVSDVSTRDMLFDDKGNMLDINGNVTSDPAQQAQHHTQQLDANGNPILGPDGKPLRGDPMFSMMHRTYTTNYIQLDLPFNYYHRLGESRYLTFTAGPWLACGLAGRRTTEGDGTATNDRKVRYTDATFSLPGARRFDCGLKAGFGYQFPSSLTINLEGEFGLLKTNSITVYDTQGLPSAIADPFAGRAGRNVSLLLTLSYRLNKSKWKAND